MFNRKDIENISNRKIADFFTPGATLQGRIAILDATGLIFWDFFGGCRSNFMHRRQGLHVRKPCQTHITAWCVGGKNLKMLHLYF